MITLVHGDSHATIDPEGAWVSELAVSSDQLLFPRTTLADTVSGPKVRGGMHVCLPNFGPGGESGLTQHGFGRTSLWSIVQQGASSVTLELETTTHDYVGLVATLEYSLENGSFTARLSLTNRGIEVIRVAPGFHPYFALSSSESTVTVNDELFELNELAGTEYRVAESARLTTDKHQILMTTENLTTWAIWTDQLGSYVCVEPTFGGNRFLEPEQPDEQLAPNETKTYSVRITW